MKADHEREGEVEFFNRKRENRTSITRLTSASCQEERRYNNGGRKKKREGAFIK